MKAIYLFIHLFIHLFIFDILFYFLIFYAQACMTDTFHTIAGIVLFFILGIIRDSTMMMISHFMGDNHDDDENRFCNYT